MWQFKNNKNATEMAKKISYIYSQGVITGYQALNWFSKFCSGDVIERNLNHGAHQTWVKML